MKKLTLTAASSLIALTASLGAAQADKLTLYCSAQEDWCQLMARSFEDATGIDVDMTRKSSGETFAQIRAESSNPKGDVWWGGTGDPHLQAAEEGLTMEYVSPMRDQLHDWAISQAESAGNKTIGIYSGALGYGYNSELLEANGLAEPSCWKDLLKPEYKGHVQMANPNSLGHGLHHSCVDGADIRRRRWVRVHEGTARRTSTNTPSQAPPRSKRQAAARTPSASSSCTTR